MRSNRCAARTLQVEIGSYSVSSTSARWSLVFKYRMCTNTSAKSAHWKHWAPFTTHPTFPVTTNDHHCYFPPLLFQSPVYVIRPYLAAAPQHDVCFHNRPPLVLLLSNLCKSPSLAALNQKCVDPPTYLAPLRTQSNVSPNPGLVRPYLTPRIHQH